MGEYASELGRLRRSPRPRLRLDPRLRPLRHAARLPPRARHPVRRLRRLPRPRLTAHMHRNLPRPPPPLLGLPVLRHQPPLTALPMGDDLRRPARAPARRPAWVLGRDAAAVP